MKKFLYTLFHITPYPHRIYVFNRHLHHGTDGLVLILIGLGLMIHDRRDYRIWLSDILRP
jgi:hypothetical protein